MRPGLGSFAFGWAVRHGSPPLDESRLIRIARRHRLQVVQLGDNLPVHEMDAARRSRLRDLVAASALELELGARGLTPSHLSAYIGLCRELRCRLLRFVIDRDRYEPSSMAIVSLLKDAVPELRASGVTLALENHDRFEAETLRDIVDAVGDWSVGVCLDTANSFGAGQGLSHVTRVLAPVTVNLHLKDVTIARAPHQMGFVIAGCPLGRGALPLSATIAAVGAAGRCRSAILEAWTPRAATLAKTVRREAAWARRSLAALPAVLDPSMRRPLIVDVADVRRGTGSRSRATGRA